MYSGASCFTYEHPDERLARYGGPSSRYRGSAARHSGPAAEYYAPGPHKSISRLLKEDSRAHKKPPFAQRVAEDELYRQRRHEQEYRKRQECRREEERAKKVTERKNQKRREQKEIEKKKRREQKKSEKQKRQAAPACLIKARSTEQRHADEDQSTRTSIEQHHSEDAEVVEPAPEKSKEKKRGVKAFFKKIFRLRK